MDGGSPSRPMSRLPRYRLALLAIAFPIFLLPIYPAFCLQLFKIREPLFRVPVALSSPIQIRDDPYGSGLFGAPRNGGRRHNGIDLVAPVGTRVLAAKSGMAVIGRKRNGMGRYAEVRHPDGWVTRYGHLKEIRIHDRQRVHRGDCLGTVGKSGNARRRRMQPHLHFEVWNEKKEVLDPLTVMEVARGE